MGISVKSIDYVEIDEKAVRSYNAMFSDEMGYDIQNVVGYNLKPDILVHGSPCQDFSIAGHQKGADAGSETRSSLMWETVHIIEQMGEWKPKIVIWENVKNVLSKHMIHNFNKYIEYMNRLGYTSSYKVLDARDYGLPQARQRCFTVSILGDIEFDFTDMKTKEMLDINNFIDNQHFSKCHIVTQPSVLSVIGQKGIKRATIIEKYANTITTRQDRTPAQVIQYGENKYRYLTEKECWKLQGFSDGDFEAAKSTCEVSENKMNRVLYKQAGNSIPVSIFESMFEAMIHRGLIT